MEHKIWTKMPEIKRKQVLKYQKVPECEIYMATEHSGGTWNLFVWEGGHWCDEVHLGVKIQQKCPMETICVLD